MANDWAISIHGLTYTYPNGTRALDGVDLEVRQGEYVAIMGANGAGKTTLCLFLNGVVPHITGGRVKGRVRVLGMDTFEHHVYELAQIVGMVLQDPEAQLFTSSVRAEVAFAAENLGMERDEIIERVMWALKTVRLEGLEDRTPAQLSGGQKQRLSVASGLVVQPQLMVLDEPTSQLDPLGTEEVFSVLRTLNEELGLTIVLATHKSERVARFADRVVVLDEGSVVGEGTPAEVFSQVELLDRIHVQVPAVTRVECTISDCVWETLRISENPKGLKAVTLEESRACLSGLLADGSLCVTSSSDFGELSRAVEPCESPPQTDHELQVAQPEGLPFGLAQGKPRIDVQDVRYAYPGMDVPALDGVSLRVWPGEFVGLIGQNGAGKTTLVKAILGLLRPSDGRVLVDGEDVAQTSPARLARRIGLVLQNPDTQLFALSAEEEVAFGPRNCGLSEEEIRARVEQALRQVGLWEKREQYPFNFSFGDRRKISVAAVAAMCPQVLIFDEPTTGQDYRGRYELADIARELNRSGTTVIMITHDMDLIAEYTERVVVMGKGRVLLDDLTREVFQEGEVLAQTSIAPPQVTQLAQALGEYGVPPGVLTTDELGALFAPGKALSGPTELAQVPSKGGRP
ncbi:MAG: ATP-binding cassette domain-containing protein [Anaerolineae bacterium]|nr:ATP-binding cassette domain-containing protein [Anaerolineae bacterium]